MPDTREISWHAVQILLSTCGIQSDIGNRVWYAKRSQEKRVQDDWSWVGEDGVEHHGNESQLAAGLSAQRLAPYTLVTRTGWRDWLPAMAVAELQSVLPHNSRDVVRTPTARTHLPKLPPPLHEYPALRLRHQGLQQGVTPIPSRPRRSIPSRSSRPRTSSAAWGAATASPPARPARGTRSAGTRTIIFQPSGSSPPINRLPDPGCSTSSARDAGILPSITPATQGSSIQQA